MPRINRRANNNSANYFGSTASSRHQGLADQGERQQSSWWWLRRCGGWRRCCRGRCCSRWITGCRRRWQGRRGPRRATTDLAVVISAGRLKAQWALADALVELEVGLLWVAVADDIILVGVGLGLFVPGSRRCRGRRTPHRACRTRLGGVRAR